LLSPSCDEVDYGSRDALRGDLAAHLCSKVAEQAWPSSTAARRRESIRRNLSKDTGPQSTSTERIRFALNQLMGETDLIIDGEVIEENRNG
jgi:hypothetical protein